MVVAVGGVGIGTSEYQPSASRPPPPPDGRTNGRTGIHPSIHHRVARRSKSNPETDRPAVKAETGSTNQHRHRPPRLVWLPSTVGHPPIHPSIRSLKLDRLHTRSLFGHRACDATDTAVVANPSNCFRAADRNAQKGPPSLHTRWPPVLLPCLSSTSTPRQSPATTHVRYPSHPITHRTTTKNRPVVITGY